METIKRTKPQISILCLAYNHEKYIRKALDSILAQKTKNQFEIIVSDDASTDDTRRIILEYQHKYPDIIIPLLFDENQYSQHKSITTKMYQLARGKYLAFCECDDFFIDEYKLQKQASFLDEHSDYIACVHAAIKIREDGYTKCGIRTPLVQKETLFVQDIIQSIGNNYALNSLMTRKSALQELPKFYYDSPIEDIPLAIYLSLNGKFYYTAECMSAYRVGAVGSWTQKQSADIKKQEQYLQTMIQVMREVDVYTCHQYNKEITDKIEMFKFQSAWSRSVSEVFKSKVHRKYYYELKFKTKFKIWAGKLKKWLLR